MALPNLSNAVRAWSQKFTFDRITKSIVDYQLVETKSVLTFKGHIVPLSPTDLEIKPEGQRQWNWYEVHTTTALELDLDDEVYWKSKKYRVMSKTGDEDYGFYRYEIAEAFT